MPRYKRHYCRYALTLSICREWTLEQSFLYLAMGELPKTRLGFDITKNDIEDMVIFRTEGLSYKDIGEMYNAKWEKVYSWIRRHQKQKGVWEQFKFIGKANQINKY